MSEGLPVDVTCRVVGVSVSGFYEWKRRKPSARAVRHAMVADVIRQVHEASRQTYGARRVHAELVLGRNMTVARCTVELVMRRLGLAGLPGRPKYRKIPNTPTAEDLVNRDFATSEPNRLWMTDITEHRTREGKVYCAVVLDAFSRRVVGWSIDSSKTANLVVNALGMAIENRQEAQGVVVHSDHGTPFNSPHGHSPAVPWTRVWCRRWDRSETATTTDRWSRSGHACKSSSSTANAGSRASSWPTRSSSTLRSSTTGNDGTRLLGCSPPSSTNSVTPTSRPAIKQADRAKPGAHESLQQTQGGSAGGQPEATSGAGWSRAPGAKTASVWALR